MYSYKCASSSLLLARDENIHASLDADERYRGKEAGIAVKTALKLLPPLIFQVSQKQGRIFLSLSPSSCN